MAAVKAWSEKWYFAEAVNILCQESHEHTKPLDLQTYCNLINALLANKVAF